MDSVALIFGSVVLSSAAQLILKAGMTAQGIQDAIKTGDPTEIQCHPHTHLLPWVFS
jgi:hypothetical protein